MAQLCREVAAVMQEFTRMTLLIALRLWNLLCVQPQCSVSCLRHPDRLRANDCNIKRLESLLLNECRTSS